MRNVTQRAAHARRGDQDPADRGADRPLQGHGDSH
jgi:hypothetical protein